MLLRARFFFNSFSKLPAEFRLRDVHIKTQIVQQQRNGIQTTLLDILFERTDLKEAYYEAIDIANEIADSVAFLSHDRASFELLSVTVPSVRLNEEFQIAVPDDGFYRRSNVVIDKESIEQLCNSEKEETTSIALRAYRLGLTSDSPYNKFTELWTAAETLAKVKAKSLNDYVEHKCPNTQCTEVRRTDLASQQYVRDFFQASKMPDSTEKQQKDLANEARVLRGQLVHGSRLHNAELRAKADLKTTSLQSAAALAIAEAVNMTPLSDHCPHMGVPFSSFIMKRAGPTPTDCQLIRPLFFGVTAQFSMLPKDRLTQKPQDFEFETGVFGGVPFHPFALPDLVVPPPSGVSITVS